MATAPDIERLRLDLQVMAPRWGLSSRAELKFLSHSENTTFLAADPDSGARLILRVHRVDYHTPEEIRSEIDWIRALIAERVVVTPAPVPDRDGAFLRPLDLAGASRQVAAFAYMSGEEPNLSSGLPAWFEKLGALSARLHEHSRRWAKPVGFWRKTWDFDAMLGSRPLWGDWRDGIGLADADRKLLQRVVEALWERLSRYGETPDRFGLIHADLRLANLLVDGDRLGVIDFDDCGISWFFYDFASAVSFYEHEPIVPELREAWLSGYRTVAPVEKDDEAMLPAFVMLRRLLLTAWIASHHETATAQALGANYTQGTAALGEAFLATLQRDTEPRLPLPTKFLRCASKLTATTFAPPSPATDIAARRADHGAQSWRRRSAKMDIQAYFEEWSLKPGDTARLAISTPHPSVRATLVRLLSGPGKAPAVEGRTSELPDILDLTAPGRLQSTVVGSYAALPLPALLSGGAVTIHCWIWPTVPERPRPQTVWSVGDVALVVHAGGIEARAKGARLVGIEGAVVGKHWYSVAVTLDGRNASIELRRLDGKIDTLHSASEPSSTTFAGDTFILAAAGTSATGSPISAFNGKIDSPTVFQAVPTAAQRAAWREGGPSPDAPWASWRFCEDFAAETIKPAFAGAVGRIVNGAERGVTGRNWDGTSDSFIEKPDQYCALQFHDDDMVESGWAYDIAFTLPRTLKSGVYAVRLEAGGARNHYPLFVRGPSDATAPVLFLAPTNTYLAYANDHLASLDFSSVMPHDKVVPADEQYLFDHPEPGRSCYDTHGDGSPVRYSSRRRPIVNVRPGFPNWLTGSYRHFPVDTYLIEWLDHVGLDYHVATDEDLEREGRNLLDRYAVVVTGSHPEYWTREGLDILDSYLKNGGRAMYLGGNGFYWVTSRVKDKPWVIEVRRDNSGTRCWDAPHGERTHVATSEAGGIWRNRGRAPNKIVGVGFSSEGWSKGCGYRRSEVTYKAPVAKLFEGVTEDVVGAYGHVLGGAVGDEVDRFDVALGSPEHTYVLGTSTGLGNEYQLVIEDLILSLPDQGGAQRPDQVKSDMVLFPIDGGGWVFSVGSITYAGSLAWNGCDNGLSRLTANVLRAFASKGPVLG